jgi:hypothetical protein
MLAFARCRSLPRQRPPVGSGFAASRKRTLASSVVSLAVVDTLEDVEGCRGVRDGTEVRRSRWVEGNRAIARLCTDRLTALLTATLTAVLTGDPVGRFLRSDHHAVEGSARSELTATLTATLTDPVHSPVSGRARPAGRGSISTASSRQRCRGRSRRQLRKARRTDGRRNCLTSFRNAPAGEPVLPVGFKEAYEVGRRDHFADP